MVSVQKKNEIHKILWDLEIQTGHQILARRPIQVLVKKERAEVDLAVTQYSSTIFVYTLDGLLFSIIHKFNKRKGFHI